MIDQHDHCLDKAWLFHCHVLRTNLLQGRRDKEMEYNLALATESEHSLGWKQTRT